MKEELNSMFLVKLGWPARVINALHDAGIDTFADLTAYSEEQLLTVLGVGEGTLNIICRGLSEYGLSLAGEPRIPRRPGRPSGVPTSGGAAI